MSADAHRHALLTGFPTTPLARGVLSRLLHDDRALHVDCVVLPSALEHAEAAVAALEPHARDRVTLLPGDAAAIDLGLSGREWTALAERVQLVHGCAAVSYSWADRELAERVNIGSAQELLELADAAPRLERVVYWSTTRVSGSRRGYVREDELRDDFGFRGPVEESRMRAEAVVREGMQRHDIVILRPSHIVDVLPGAGPERLDGPYLLAQIMLDAPMDIPLPVPGGGDTPIHVVPLDYVLDAGMAIAAHPDAAGRTFHLVDGRPVTVRRALELVATSCARPAPRIAVPTRWAAKLVRNTGLERLANVPRAFLEEISTEVIYDDTNTRELLSGTEIECPPFETYVDAIVGRVRRQRTAEREALEDQRAKAHSTV